MDDSQVWETLGLAQAAYIAATSPAYDQVLTDVADRIQATGSIGKADIGALLFWKRLRADTRWVPRLMTLEEPEVRAVTTNAVKAVTDGSLTVPEAAYAGRGALTPLPGFRTGDALASALLLAAAPERMAVYDRRARAGLMTLGRTLSAAPGRYGRYMALVEELRLLAQRNGHVWSARNVDVALYCLGGPNQLSA
ncbi:hypothetical protein FBY31_4374 [Arthrobacter sp. SLBN-100]|uniref:hypothetical protein n=1 Tax=Arthrobacter sp. SLBN-100 TaxID=2768450 RepID=UPI00116BA264|nr:hypothetical protein [Arthrobacter sp. SLBN-100]TQJ62000.1 hypothetical protein FBY31_4374 [Arthrobacter sp. SLBN-100]